MGRRRLEPQEMEQRKKLDIDIQRNKTQRLHKGLGYQTDDPQKKV
jgi:hypothetical protein